MTQTQIVDRIHQVLIVDGLSLPHRLPRKIVENREHALQLYPGATYKLWSGEELRGLIKSELGREVLYAFDTLTPYSYKCDLGRYCILFALGGLYFDLAVRLLNKWEIPTSCGAAAFTEMYPGMESWTATQTSLLWSKPGRPEWRHAIDWIVANCKSQYYGPHDHYPTAGALLGRAFALVMSSRGQSFAADDQWVGECRYVTPERPLQNLCYVAPSRQIIGIRTKLAAGDLTELEVSGTNNYTTIYRKRQVYGESVRTWRFDDPRLVTDGGAYKTPTGIASLGSATRRICYGPFVDLGAGRYTLELTFSPDAFFERIGVDITASYAREVVADYSDGLPAAADGRSVAVDFSLDSDKEAVECRVSVFGDFRGELIALSVARSTKALVWLAIDKSIECGELGKTVEGISVPLDYEGRTSWGPYAHVPAGSHKLRVTFTEETGYSRFMVEVCCDGGQTVVCEYDYNTAISGQLSVIDIPFVLHSSKTDLEFRSSVFGDFLGTIVSFSLTLDDSGVKS